MPYDLALYLCTPGKPYRLVGFGDELCQLQVVGSTGYAYQVKNTAAETLWYDNQFIYRGLDTSSKDDPSNPEVYAQFTKLADGTLRYGAPWAKRSMDIGEAFKRSTDVQHFTRTGGLKNSDSNIVSYLRLLTHYPAYSFAFNGQQRLVNDVVLLAWTLDPAGTQIVERYWYGKGLGLVSFQFIATGQQSFIVPGDPPRAPVREVLSWFKEPVPPPTVATPPPPVYPPGTQPVLSLVKQGGVRLRANPGTAEATIRNLNLNEQVTVYQQPVVNKDTYDWVRVQTAANENGWAAKVINGVATFAPVPPAFHLKMPFKSPIITSRFNDPRDYSKIAPTKLQKHEGIDIVDGIAAQYGSDPTIHVGAAGTVVEAGFQATGYGNYIRVNLGNNWFVYYGHMAEVYVKQGQVLKEGQIIGLMGDTGFAEGKHVHITVQHIGAGLANYVVADVVNPEPLLVAL